MSEHPWHNYTGPTVLGGLHSVFHFLQAPCGGLLPNLLEGRQLPSIEMKIAGSYDIRLHVLTVAMCQQSFMY